MLKRWFDGLESAFGIRAHTLKAHLLQHLPDWCLFNGSPLTNSCFSGMLH